MTTLDLPGTTIALAEPAATLDPDALLRRLATAPYALFEAFVLGRREVERERLSGLVQVVAEAGAFAGSGLRAGDLLVRGAMGEGRAFASQLVTGELHDRRDLARADLEPEGRLLGRYAWVVEGGSRPRARDDRFARRVADRRGFLPLDQVILREVPQQPAISVGPTPPPSEWEPEAVQRRSPEYIRWYQDALNRIESAGLAVDGIAGPLTRAAVRRYQQRKGLAVDGVVGPNTERALMQDGAGTPPGFDGGGGLSLPLPWPFPPLPIPPLPFPPFPPAPTPVATAVRIRKNVNALTPAERTAFTTAVNELKRRRVWHEFVRDHANSMLNAHRQPAFLPWHRQFILILESELRAIDPSVTLPYWDWSNDPGRDSAGTTTWNAAMVALAGGNGSGPTDAVTTGPFAGWTVVDSSGADTPMPLQRTFGRVTSSLPIASDVTTALGLTPYDAAPWDDGPGTTGFRNTLEGWAATRTSRLHNGVHVWVGGSMLPGTSPNDPCFFLHHCFVDKIWADWQAAHPALTYLPSARQVRGGGRVDAWGLNDDVPVFRVTSASPVTYKAADTLDLRTLRDHRGATGIEVRYV